MPRKPKTEDTPRVIVPRTGTGMFGRRSGPDAPPAVPFVKVLLPGVAYERACIVAGQCIGRVRRADHPDTHAAVRQTDNDARRAACVKAVQDIASGKVSVSSPKRTVVTGKKGQTYTAQEVCEAIVKAFAFLAKHNPPQRVKYIDRCGSEADRALRQGKAGDNPLGWSDSDSVNADAVKRANEEEIAAALRKRAARSGPNAPAAVYRKRQDETVVTPRGAGRRRGATTGTGATGVSATGAKRPARVTPVKPGEALPLASGAPVTTRPARPKRGASTGATGATRPTRPTVKGSPVKGTPAARKGRGTKDAG